uniref:Uncharacterized protein n=1 Tax=Caenorhabditis japonica TaxID=281687 RepID=A0A8R1EJR1_CAEJA
MIIGNSGRSKRLRYCNIAMEFNLLRKKKLNPMNVGVFFVSMRRMSKPNNYYPILHTVVYSGATTHPTQLERASCSL